MANTTTTLANQVPITTDHQNESIPNKVAHMCKEKIGRLVSRGLKRWGIKQGKGIKERKDYERLTSIFLKSRKEEIYSIIKLILLVSTTKILSHVACSELSGSHHFSLVREIEPFSLSISPLSSARCIYHNEPSFLADN